MKLLHVELKHLQMTVVKSFSQNSSAALWKTKYVRVSSSQALTIKAFDQLIINKL